MPLIRIASRSNAARRCVATVLLSLSLAIPCAVAAGPETAGTAVSPGGPHVPGTPYNPEAGPTAIPDGTGGAFVAYKTPSDPQYFYFHVGRVDATGAPVPGWAPAGIIGIEGDGTDYADVFPAGLDRVWVLVDANHANSYVVRKIGPLGLTLPDTTVYLGVFTGSNSGVPLTGGGVLVARQTVQLGLAIISPDGALTVPAEVAIPGTWPVPTETQGPPMIGDDAGGAWVLVNNAKATDSKDLDLFAVRVTGAGSPVFTPAYRTVCSAQWSQLESALVPDGAGGFIAAWCDRRNLGSNGDIYATHMLADGSVAPGWPAQGKAIASFPGDQFQPAMLPDGAGGAWLAWTDSRSGENDIYFTRLGADGVPAPGYIAGGRPLCAATGSQLDPHLASDGIGGFYAVWLDARDGEIDLYGQHIWSTGEVTPGWDQNGLPICTDPTEQQFPGVALISPGHALATWTDRRSGDARVYAAAMPADGPVAGVPPHRAGVLELRCVQNPARDAIELVISSAPSGSLALTLHDVMGRVLGERVIIGPATGVRARFDTRALKPGLYFVSATGAATATARVALAH